MRKKQMHKSSLFLMELIIAIVFFVLVSAVCLQFFVKSRLLSGQARELNAAVNKVSSTAEYLLRTDASEEFPSKYFGKDFVECGQEKSVYELRVTPSIQGTMKTFLIEFVRKDSGELIYELTVEQYLPGEKEGI